MKQLLLVLGVVSFFFMQNLSAQDDLEGNGKIYPTQECKKAVFDFLYPNPGNNNRPREKGDDIKSYTELVGALDKAAEKRLARFSKRRIAAEKISDVTKKRNALEQVVFDEGTFRTAAKSLSEVCDHNILWTDNAFQIRRNEGGFSSPPAKATPEAAQ
jgi:hypothetical protein